MFVIPQGRNLVLFVLSIMSIQGEHESSKSSTCARLQSLQLVVMSDRISELETSNWTVTGVDYKTLTIGFPFPKIGNWIRALNIKRFNFKPALT